MLFLHIPIPIISNDIIQSLVENSYKCNSCICRSYILVCYGIPVITGIIPFITGDYGPAGLSVG